ncbi:restriction endonuclease [Prevotella sp. P4-119]|uniref:restriction endonuclease n=1 Tax=Prevotella sp. P4-119 TaxID=2024218 RepID=UPI000B9633A2|nr:restriction endonuclease [Prevotella sp. P4-119]OYP41842.1 restriction endonuclease [Prevotella sp. P4-119]
MIPTFEEFLYPFLLMLKDGEISSKEMKEKLIAHFKLTEDDIALTTKGGNTTQVTDRIGWCRQYFRRALFIEIPQRGIWKLTDRGKAYLANHNTLTIDDLLDYKEFAEYAGSAKKPKKAVMPTKPSFASLGVTPTEALEEAYTSINDSLSDELLSMIMNLSPSFFEKLVVDLLVAMGYGGDFEDAAKVTKKSKDGGVDGIIKEDKLGLDKIYIQAKRWTNVVGEPVIQQFAGALDGKRASKGVFITTSTYSKDAKKYVDSLSKKIVLIDGKELASLMIEYNLGVSIKKSYIVKRIDTDYFDEGE